MSFSKEIISCTGGQTMVQWTLVITTLFVTKDFAVMSNLLYTET